LNRYVPIADWAVEAAALGPDIELAERGTDNPVPLELDKPDPKLPLIFTPEPKLPDRKTAPLEFPDIPEPKLPALETVALSRWAETAGPDKSFCVSWVKGRFVAAASDRWGSKPMKAKQEMAVLSGG